MARVNWQKDLEVLAEGATIPVIRYENSGDYDLFLDKKEKKRCHYITTMSFALNCVYYNTRPYFKH